MRVLITGGTGFVGSHTAAAAVRAGHDVRLLVRRPERVAPAMAPFGIDLTDVVAGDVLDPDSVRSALPGCEAVINAAAVYTLDPRRAGEVLATNARAAQIVLDAAVAAGLDPVIQVSSIAALLPSAGVLEPDSPAGAGGPPYSASKAASDLVARRHQAAGAPVVTTYPGIAIGPHDPYFGNSDFTFAMFLRNRLPFLLPGGFAVADVRYVAQAHAKMLQPGQGPRRYLLSGHYLTSSEVFTLLRKVTGRRLPAVPAPGWLARAAGRAMDGVQQLTPARCPFGYEAAWFITGCAGTDDTRTRQELGVIPPPLEQTVTDTILWMVQAGHLSARHAGHLAPQHPGRKRGVPGLQRVLLHVPGSPGAARGENRRGDQAERRDGSGGMRGGRLVQGREQIQERLVQGREQIRERLVEERERLEEERERGRERVAALERESAGLAEAASSAGTDDEHDPEGATLAFERQHAAALLEAARERVAAVDAALRRLAEGRYGACERCGRPIGAERLAARPTALTCIRCAGSRRQQSLPEDT